MTRIKTPESAEQSSLPLDGFRLTHRGWGSLTAAKTLGFEPSARGTPRWWRPCFIALASTRHEFDLTLLLEDSRLGFTGGDKGAHRGPLCGFPKLETMSANACQHTYRCEGCQALLAPRHGDCCVFCSYADHACRSSGWPRGTAPSPPAHASTRGSRPTSSHRRSGSCGGCRSSGRGTTT